MGSSMLFAASVRAFFTLIGIATAAELNQADWLIDATSGCRIPNPNPQENEAVTWSGDCQNGIAEGRGVLQWFAHAAPTDRYEGELHEGKANGHGVLTTRTGDRYDGEWRDGKANGLGRVVTSNYNYTGIWSDGCSRDGNKTIGVGRDPTSCP